MSGPEASFSELRVWLTMVHMSGGEVFLSDSLARLNAKGFAALAKLFPVRKTPARPLDLFLNSPPRFWLTGGKRPRLAVFNWEDAPSPITVPAGLDLPSEGKDVWTGEARASFGEDGHGGAVGVFAAGVIGTGGQARTNVMSEPVPR